MVSVSNIFFELEINFFFTRFKLRALRQHDNYDFNNHNFFDELYKFNICVKQIFNVIQFYNAIIIF